jgi:pimeloyl-ACP methyl ester carboxylesterase
MKNLYCILLLSLSISYLPLKADAQTSNEPSQKQVKFYFPGAKLPPDYTFHFAAPFQEVRLLTRDSISLNGVLFKVDNTKGVILYLHGNTDGIDKWGWVSKTYTDLHYDLFLLDYRGYGKSQGHIKNENELYEDVQLAYNYLKSIYGEGKIIVLGYSMGTGPAAYLAANNIPQKLILQAPYYSLPDAMVRLRPSFDTSKMAFHFNTYQYLKRTKTPVVIFHGDQDKMFYYGSSEKLSVFFKPGDKLITLKGAGHPFMDKNPVYLDSLKQVLQ